MEGVLIQRGEAGVFWQGDVRGCRGAEEHRGGAALPVLWEPRVGDVVFKDRAHSIEWVADPRRGSPPPRAHTWSDEVRSAASPSLGAMHSGDALGGSCLFWCDDVIRICHRVHRRTALRSADRASGSPSAHTAKDPIRMHDGRLSCHKISRDKMCR